MSPTDNPDAIVALATKVLGTSNPKNSLRHITPDFQRGLNPFVDKRTATVLDSIASICISEARYR